MKRAGKTGRGGNLLKGAVSIQQPASQLLAHLHTPAHQALPGEKLIFVGQARDGNIQRPGNLLTGQILVQLRPQHRIDPLDEAMVASDPRRRTAQLVAVASPMGAVQSVGCAG